MHDLGRDLWLLGLALIPLVTPLPLEATMSELYILYMKLTGFCIKADHVSGFKPYNKYI